MTRIEELRANLIEKEARILIVNNEHQKLKSLINDLS